MQSNGSSVLFQRIFTKTESVKFRDKEGRPLSQPIRKSSSRTPISDKLLEQKPTSYERYKTRSAEEKKIYREEYQKARTKCSIVELHGTVNESICLGCSKIFPITTLVNKVLRAEEVACEKCGGMLKPNAIFFGEPLDAKVIEQADKMIDNCDLLIVLGSSLLVSPVSFYPSRAISRGAKVVIINIQKTYIDDQAEVVIHDKIGKILPLIVDLVEKKLNL